MKSYLISFYTDLWGMNESVVLTHTDNKITFVPN